MGDLIVLKGQLFRGLMQFVIISVAFLHLCAAAAAETLKLFHPNVVTYLVTKNSDGHQLGDLRVVSIPMRNASAEVVGRMDALLITTGIDTPGKGDETRISELVFTLNDGGVLIIGGAGHYPAQGPTLSRGVALVRPIKGGSGKYAGARGWAESIHGDDGNWSHTFNIMK
jgi:hypothetical protein